MDIEQLKLILETLKGATGEAKDLIIFWVLADAIPSLLKFCVVSTGAYYVARRVVSAITLWCDDTDTVAAAREYLYPGPVWSDMTGSERLSVKRFISEAIEAKKAGKF